MLGLWAACSRVGAQSPFPSARLVLGSFLVPTRAHVEVGSDMKLLTRTLTESCLCLLPECSDSESQEAVIQNIARRLAQVGDEMDHRIQPTLVRRLAAQFMNASLSEEVRM